MTELYLEAADRLWSLVKRVRGKVYDILEGVKVIRKLWSGVLPAGAIWGRGDVTRRDQGPNGLVRAGERGVVKLISRGSERDL